MIGEIDFYGVFIPPLLVMLAFTIPIAALLRRILERAGVYHLVWHRPLFDVSLLIIALGVVAACLYRWSFL